MRTSKKRILTVIGFIAVAVIVNCIATFLLTPYASPSSEMWDKYRARKGQKIDMIYVGTSQCYEGIDPDIMDRITGLSSQNMGTNAQSFLDSKRAIRAAAADHRIKEVVFVIDYMYMMSGTERYAKPEATFVYAENRGQSLGKRIRNGASFVFDKRYFGKPESIAFFFPWLNNTNKFPKTIPFNIKAKLGLVKIRPDNQNYLRTAKGFKTFDRTINYNTVSRQERTTWNSRDLSKESMDTLKEICSFCKSRGIRLTVVGAPVPISYVLSYGGDYFQRYTYLKEFFKKYDVPFYDMNLADQRLYHRDATGFKDWDHTNVRGAEAFSEALGRLIKESREGKDVSGYFYSRDDFLASVSYIDTVNLEVKAEKGKGIRAGAYAYYGSGVQAEYQFAVRRTGEKKFHIFRKYGSGRTAVYYPKTSGNYEIRVYARTIGSTAPFERFYTKQAAYWA